MKNSKKKSLENRFMDFLSSRIEVQNIDGMEIPIQHKNSKKADYIINGNIVVEVKSLEEDPSYKVDKKLDPHRDRTDFPLFYWNAELDDILKHLPDGKEIREKIFFSITKSLQKAIEKADDQIEATKTILDEPKACGALVLLNEAVQVLEPKVVAYVVRYMLNKKNKNNVYRYRNINFAYFISEAHSFKINENLNGDVLLIIEGPTAKFHPIAIEKFESLNMEWAQYNDAPLYEVEGDIPDFSKLPITGKTKTTQKQNEDQMARHELWRKQYKEKPYLRDLNEEFFIKYGEKVIIELAPHFLKGHPKKEEAETLKLMIMWTHFLEEAEYRKFDMKKLNNDFSNL